MSSELAIEPDGSITIPGGATYVGHQNASQAAYRQSVHRRIGLVAMAHGPRAQTTSDPAKARGNGVLVWFGEVSDFDGVVERAGRLGVEVIRAPHRNPPEGEGNGPSHREIWIRDPDGYVVVIANPDGEAWES